MWDGEGISTVSAVIQLFRERIKVINKGQMSLVIVQIGGVEDPKGNGPVASQSITNKVIKAINC